ncbi:MAG: hypothetical protein MI975_14440 [Cytophagales bacterium]|nr:hypothetical protein [Cytophagales bacterium]
MKPARTERIQDAHEQDCIALCVSNPKKHKRMKPARPERIQGTYGQDYIALCIS